ncbi:MAG: hypothetical protein N2203_04560 [Bacteroidia bacterium]|nr:hypothetical protein [Bacteroidia bacterium]
MQYHYLICHLCKKYTRDNAQMNQLLYEYSTQFITDEHEIEKYQQQLLEKLNI